MWYVREQEMRGVDIWMGYATGSIRCPFAASLEALRQVLVKAREFVLGNFASTPSCGDWFGLGRFDDCPRSNINRIK